MHYPGPSLQSGEDAAYDSAPGGNSGSTGNIICIFPPINIYWRIPTVCLVVFVRIEIGRNDALSTFTDEFWVVSKGMHCIRRLKTLN